MILNTMNKWLTVIMNNEDSFMDRFVDVDTIMDTPFVTWNSCCMVVGYVDPSGQHISNRYNMGEWLEWLNDQR